MNTTFASFRAVVRSTLESTPVRAMLAKGGAVVLERIACGGGATRWYFCRDGRTLTNMEGEFSPGSVISFYFDDRIRQVVLSPSVRSQSEQLIARHGEAVVGVRADETHIRVDFPGGPGDLEEFLGSIAPDAALFIGAFPARDNDGVCAVTVTLPDADGIVRAHPH